MEAMFEPYRLGELEVKNRFVFPPVKTGFGLPGGGVTERQVTFYRRIAQNGPGIIILEPAAVTAEGQEHPKQLCIHQPDSVVELQKIVDVIHKEKRLVCLHVNHAGAAANPKVTGSAPRSASALTCPRSGQTAEALSDPEIDTILAGYTAAAEKAVQAGVDLLEVQGGHGYLVSQFLNRKTNKRGDHYGQHREAFAEKVLAAVNAGAPHLPVMVRISGDEMSPDFGIEQADLAMLLQLAEAAGALAVHVGMGSSCFSPPWYFHHSSLPEKPQMDALGWVREQTSLPVVVAGRMGRPEKIDTVRSRDLAELVALGRPLICDPDLIEKWRTGSDHTARYCGYCLQGCLHRLKNGQPLGCNLNPTVGMPDLSPSERPLKVLVAGGGPAGMSAAVYLSQRGHRVILAEKEKQLGGQFLLAWQAPGKKTMQDGLEALRRSATANAEAVFLGRTVDASLVNEVRPDLLVWAAGAQQNIPDIDGLGEQYTLTAVEYFGADKEIRGPRILVIGAGRSGLEIAEKLGRQGYEVVATKRTDPIGSMMEMITKKLTLMRIGQLPNVTLMPHTAVTAFTSDAVEVQQDGVTKYLAAFQTVILASGMHSAPAPADPIRKAVANVEIIGDAAAVQDIFSAVTAGYELAQRY